MADKEFIRRVRKKFWYGSIESIEEAQAMVVEATNAYFLIAALTLVIDTFLFREAIINALLYAILAFLLRRYHSRWVALILVAFSTVGLVMTVINIAAGNGGTNLIIALGMVWIGIRAFQATRFIFLKNLNKDTF